MAQNDLIVSSVSDGIATVRLNDPGSMNALSVPMAERLQAVLREMGADESVRVLVLTGTGRGFCAGGDVQSFYDNRDAPHEVMNQILDGLHGAVEVLLELPFPTIAAINGVVAGAGMGVALATDLAIATDEALLVMAYTDLGVSPDGSSTYFLPRLVGTRIAMDMILTNRRIDAAVSDLASRLAKGPTQTYVRSRHLLRSSLSNSPVEQMTAEGESIIAAGDTTDFYEGVTAFIEKRPPTFTGQ